MLRSHALPLPAVHVLDRLPDPPAPFTLADVEDVLQALQRAGLSGAADATAGGVLSALLAAEHVTGGAGSYVVDPDARPL